MNDLKKKCLIPGTLTNILLSRGLTLLPKDRVANKMRIEHAEPINGGPTYTVISLPLPAELNNQAAIEASVLGLGSMFGVFNHPKCLKLPPPPTGHLLDWVLHAIQLAGRNHYFGPFAFLYSPDFDSDVIERVGQVESVACCLPVAPEDKLALVQLTPNVIRLIVLPDRIVPQLRADFHDHVGIIIGGKS